MKISAAYLTVVLIWSTTPLAISLSNALGDFSFAAGARMLIGLACVGLAAAVTRTPIPIHRAACLTYFAAGVAIFGAMSLVYWSALFIPSGWISVVFGLSPLITAAMAAVVLGERSLTPLKIAALSFGVAGLAVMFASGAELGPGTVLGLAGVLLASTVHSGSAVAIKRIDARLPPLAQVFGGLVVAVPFFFVLWWAEGTPWPTEVSHTGLGALLYLGTVATTLGFSLYYFLLTHLGATQVAMIALVTPALGIAVGCLFNDEPFTLRIAVGTLLVIFGLALHELVPLRAFRRRQAVARNTTAQTSRKGSAEVPPTARAVP